ncbi:MAG: Xylose isomerase domain protein barrel [Bryobacterales bacterium]|jgi:L-ribulose-5-phosphate 3-epimerase|nr:Xylose isomerase domain protein barrel [Bryobacterales bacterium]
MNRRQFIQQSALLAGAATTAFGIPPPFRFGVTDWNLRLGADPQAVPLATKLGFEAVQVSFGRELVDGKMPLDNPDLIARYISFSKQYKTPIDGTCVDRLHDNGLKSDPLAPRWVSDSIRITRAMDVKVLLVPFFGKWKIANARERDFVGDALRELAPEAEKAGVILGIEDTISAEDNVRIMERSRSDSVKVYYDVGNSTIAGFDVLKEIRWLGKDRICQIHLKDNPHFLGEGTIQFRPVLDAIREIGFQGYENLETDARPGLVNADLKRNLEYIRRLASQT